MNTFLVIWSPGMIVAVVLVVLILFGGKKIPELMKGLGQGIKSFKDEMKDDKDNDKKIEK